VANLVRDTNDADAVADMADAASCATADAARMADMADSANRHAGHTTPGLANAGHVADAVGVANIPCLADSSALAHAASPSHTAGAANAAFVADCPRQRFTLILPIGGFHGTQRPLPMTGHQNEGDRRGRRITSGDMSAHAKGGATCHDKGTRAKMWSFMANHTLHRAEICLLMRSHILHAETRSSAGLPIGRLSRM